MSQNLYHLKLVYNNSIIINFKTQVKLKSQRWILEQFLHVI